MNATVKKMPSQTQIPNTVADFATYGDINDSNTNRSQLAVGAKVDYNDPFGKKNMNPSGRQNYDSDDNIINDAKTIGSFAAATEMTRKLCIEQNIKDIPLNIDKGKQGGANTNISAMYIERANKKNKIENYLNNNKLLNIKSELKMGAG